MNSTIDIAIISHLIFNVFVIIYLGLPSSLSVTFYELNKKKSGLGILFSINLFVVGMFTLPTWIDAGEYWYLAAIGCFMLMTVGATPYYKNKNGDTINVWHYIFAGIAAICALIWIFLDNPTKAITIFAVFSLLGFAVYKHKKTAWLYIAENIIILTLFTFFKW